MNAASIPDGWKNQSDVPVVKSFLMASSFIGALLLLTLSSAPLETEFTEAFAAGDSGRLMRLWSAQSPTRNADRHLLRDLLGDGAIARLTPLREGVLALELRDRDGTLLDRGELHVREEEGAWRAWSLVPVEPAEPVAAAHALLHRSHVHLDTGALDQAQAAAQRAAETAERTTHVPTRAAAQRTLGYLAFIRGDVETAQRHFDTAMSLARGANDRREIALSLDRLALLDHTKGDNARAEAQWLEALQIVRDLADRILTARALNSLGNVRDAQGDFAAARRYYEESLRIYESLGDAVGMSTLLNNLGTNVRAQGFVREAAIFYRRSLELSRSIDDREGVAYALANVGNTLAAQGEYREALHTFQQALAAFRQLGGNPHALAGIHYGMGAVYGLLRDYEQAREQVQAGLVLAEQSGSKEVVAAGLHNLANTWQLTDPKRALELYQKALAISEEVGDRDHVAHLFHAMGLAHDRLGDREAALRSFDRSLAMSEELGSRETMAMTLIEQAELASDPAEALRRIERARALAIEAGSSETLWQSQTTLSRIHRRAGRLDDARREAEQAVAHVEEIRRDVPGDELAQQAFESLVRAHHELIAVTVEQRDVSAALENAERAKARVLLDALRHGRPDLHAALAPAEREREAALAAAVVQANQAAAAPGADAAALERRRKARFEYDAWLTTLYAAHPQLRRERGAMTPARAADIEALLAEGAADAILEYVVTADRTFLFSITRGQNGLDLRVHAIDLTKSELEAEVRRFRELLAGRNLTYAAAARKLYDRLVAPAAAQLRGRATVCIVPDGPLWELPFQALQPSSSEFLLDRHTLYSVPSLTVLREVSRRGDAAPAAKPRLLAFGNPVVPHKPLPQSETEVRRIAALYGAANSRVHLGAGAREEAVKAEARAYDVLHFATHGILDDHNALYSHLVFSPPLSDAEDGQLEAREIMRLELRARLAVLSACETARGRIGTGEGLIGMSWALAVAGVPASVVSQWKVDSSSTAELMVELHRALRASRGTSVAQALRRAALATRAKPEYRHPFYWAPFVVVGRP
jgi:CHAT domain-containing protein/tetratricopeptide (TPR) repeat protein